MKVVAVETKAVVLPLPQPVGRALGTIARFGCILMPDLQRVGGVSEFMRIGHLAESEK
ncbi:MAG: hypothetical protein P4L90_23760 [Rhodopila sp.]|nr:hypothetical protein [Rhodopila sp.]